MILILIPLSVTLSVLYFFLVYRRLPAVSNRPPGPKGIPWIGRVWDLPRSHAYLRFQQWSKEHGDIYGITLFGTNHIFLASDKIAQDLLSKRGAVHQDRPAILQLEDSRNAPEYLPLLGHNAIWSRQRKLVTQIMTESIRANHLNIPALELPQMLLELISRPKEFQDHLENYASRIIAGIAYGDVEHYARVRSASQGLLEAISVAKHLSIIVPFLRYLPKWLSPWKREEAARHAEEREFFMRAQVGVAQRMRAGTAPWSFMKRCLESQSRTGMPDMECAYVVGMLGVAGVLTTSSAMMTYLLAMTLHPEWQVRVQEEVDRVCGDRMPVMSDSPQMPVLRAVIMEVMRWRPIVPAAIPHRTTEDDMCDGYFIPKGSHIHATTWAITRNPSLYPSPDVFDPDRWLQPSSPSYKAPLTEYPNIRNFTSFGYGRRACIGQDLTQHEFFLAMGGMAWAMTVEKKRDGMGREVEVPVHNYGALVITKPEKFEFEVRPRSEKKVMQIEEWRREANSESKSRQLESLK